MRFAVTGASGFIGRRLAALLLQDGHEVNVIGRAPRKGMPPEARFFSWDPNSGLPSPQSIDGLDAVIHLAGEPISQRWSPEIKRRIRSTRVEGTARLVEAMAAAPQPPRAFVSGSAVGYYGDRGEEILTESSTRGEGFLPDICAEWEQAANRAKTSGIRTVTVRTGVVLAADGGGLAKMLPPFRFGVGGPVGTGNQWMSWIHRDDLARLLIYAASTPALEGPVNGTAPNPVTNAEFAQALGRALRRPAILPTPRFMLKLLFGEMSEILFSSQRAIPKAAQAAGFEFKHPDVFAALKDALE
jgi:uncharacterized protein (TIGR01777 family)